jgi:hypothetical protein
LRLRILLRIAFSRKGAQLLGVSLECGRLARFVPILRGLGQSAARPLHSKETPNSKCSFRTCLRTGLLILRRLSQLQYHSFPIALAAAQFVGALEHLFCSFFFSEFCVDQSELVIRPQIVGVKFNGAFEF